MIYLLQSKAYFEITDYMYDISFHNALLRYLSLDNLGMPHISFYSLKWRTMSACELKALEESNGSWQFGNCIESEYTSIENRSPQQVSVKHEKHQTLKASDKEIF